MTMNLDDDQKSSAILNPNDSQRRRTEPVPPENAKAISHRAERHSAPLSFSQRSIWLFEQFAPGTPVYNRPANLWLRGNLNVAALELTLNEILRRHDVLRATFIDANGSLIQRVNPPSTFPLEVFDLRVWPEGDREFETQRLVDNEALGRFDLVNGPLLRAKLVRLSEYEHLMLLTFHHIVFDAWSMNVFIGEIRDLYAAYTKGSSPRLAELPIQYGDFAAWQQERLERGDFQRDLDYWKGQLSDVIPTIELPRDYRTPKTRTFNGAAHCLMLSTSLTEQLRNLGRQNSATLFMTVLATLQALLYRYSGQDDISIGVPIAGRTRKETQASIGCFVNTMVLRARFPADTTFRDLLRRTRKVALEAYAHQDLPFEELVKELRPDRTLSQTPFFQVMLNFRNRPAAAIEFDDLKIEPAESSTIVAVEDLTLDVSDKPEGLRCLFQYRTDVFEADTIKRIGDHFQTLLEGIIANPDERISALPLLTATEHQQVTLEWNRTHADFPQEHFLHHLFETQVRKTPDTVAARFEDEALTYRELNSRANQLAHYLRRLGVQPETLVAIYIEPSLEMLVAVLGVLKAGGAYAPIDPAHPRQRLAFILEDTQAAVLLTAQRLSKDLPPTRSQVICLDAEREMFERESEADPDVKLQAENPAYVVYTSGSTGDPKGVVIAHRSVCNRLLAPEGNHCDEADRLLMITSLSFDVSVWEIFIALSSGASLVIAPADATQDGAYLGRLIAAQKCTMISLTPSVLQLLLAEDDFAACDSLRRVLCGAEVLPLELQELFFTRSRAQLYNCYGPTECSIDATEFHCTRGNDAEVVPIGRPIANVQVFILDSHLQPAPIGVPGELYVGGAGLARGYLNQPDLTATRFIPNPFASERGARFYKTGDKVRYCSDGNIEFLGRVDKQIKVRGVRIEPGEIEAALMRHPLICAAVVTTRPNLLGNKILVAYGVVDNNQAIATQELRDFLQSALPDYMVPSTFVAVESFPLTPNGKIDLAALPAPDFNSIETPYVPPRNADEEMLADTWRELFAKESISVNDNFFDLGGHSLLGMKMVTLLKDRFDVKLPMRMLFEAPTIASLATRLSENGSGVVSNQVYPTALVPIQPNGKHKPLFFLMASGEEASLLSYSKLFRHVGRDQPTIGLLPPRVDSNGDALDVKGMAVECVRQIREFQASGPYWLVGYCAGGIVIFEIAQQLISDGQEVGMLLIDTFYPIKVPEHLGPVNKRFLSHFYRRIKHHLQALPAMSYRERLRYLTGRARAFGNLVEERGPDADGYMKAIGHYKPRAYDRTITLLVTEDVYQVDPAMGWSKFAKGGLEVIKIPGNHLTCMREDAHLTAQQIKECLERSRNNGSSRRLSE